LEEPLQEKTARSAPFTTLTPPGEWPTGAGDLPLVLNQHQYAHLRGVGVRTLQRERRLGTSIPYRKIGKQILYARADILARVGVDHAA
jgi:hypothetical protein